MIDVGLALGKTSIVNKEFQYSIKTEFVEARISMNACQFGIFSNEISIGGGYMFTNTTPLILEISSTIFAQVGENWGLGVIYGNYNFTGNEYDLSKNFTGLFLRYGLIRDEGGILLNRTHLMRSKRQKRQITHHN